MKNKPEHVQPEKCKPSKVTKSLALGLFPSIFGFREETAENKILLPQIFNIPLKARNISNL